MYQLLFLVHGMGCGAQPAGASPWWTDVVDDLRASAKRYGHDKDLVLSSPRPGQVLVVPITYHQIFDRTRDQWIKQAGGDETAWLPLARQLVKNDAASLAKLPGWVQSAGDFFWTYVLDVILYRLDGDTTIEVRQNVATQIAEAWSKADIDNDASTPVHFVAHSLGTAVLHDSIGVLAQDPAFGPGTHTIQSIVTLANVSWILENGFATYASVDRPINAPPPPDGMTASYFSFRHELDPIAEVIRTFRGDEHGWPADSYQDEVAIEVKDWNVHAYTHYLDNPISHLRLFERLWDSEDWASVKDKAMLDYRNSPGTPCPAAIATARQDLAAVFAKPFPATPAGFLDVVAETYRIFLKARAACKQERGQ